MSESVIGELSLLFDSGYPMLYLLTHEEERALRILRAAAKDRPVSIWSRTGQGAGSKNAELGAVLEGLKRPGRGVTVLLDAHPYLSDGEVVRRLRDLSPALARAGHALVFLSPVVSLPPELEKDVTIIDLPLPDRAAVDEIFRAVCAEEQVVFPEDFTEAVVMAARGLTENEARRVFTKALRKGGGFKLSDISLILEEKKQILRKSEVLEFIELSENLSTVGGLQEVKRWLKQRQRAFGEEAARFGLPPPKGLLLIGVQGCGKSLTAKAVAGSWHLPLLRLDLGAVFGMPSPESSLRRAIQVAESLSPVVLWVDEIEKGFAQASSAGGENVSRVFGGFITWLQEKKLPVFVVATANEVENLPPELLRKGRFDETFFVDLPDPHERKAILHIHIQRRGRDPRAFDLDALARQTEHFSGAELEQGVVAGLYRAFAENRELTTRDIQKELDEIVPLFATYEEKIKALREWSKNRARRASLDQSLVDLFEEE
jgi:SpoVK/Ycf46/Vps4 family AAA+-type ATPase